MIDSIGLGVLISARNQLKKSGGELVVTNVSKEISHLLKQMHLDRHIVFKPVD
jgi:anti-anti-sigma factor